MTIQLGEGRVEVVLDKPRHIESVKTIHADQQNMLNFMSVAEFIVGARRGDGSMVPKSPSDMATARIFCFK